VTPASSSDHHGQVPAYSDLLNVPTVCSCPFRLQLTPRYGGLTLAILLLLIFFYSRVFNFYYYEKWLLASSCLPVSLSARVKPRLPLLGISRNLIFEYLFFEYLPGKLKFHSNLIRMTGKKTCVYLW